MSRFAVAAYRVSSGGSSGFQLSLLRAAVCEHVRVDEFEVVVAAGALSRSAPEAVRFPHRWTAGGVTVEAAFTGAHLLHLAAAGCVLNDVYREAERLGVPVDGVRVRARGGFDTDDWHSTGIEYAVEIDSPAPAVEQASVLAAVDAVAEIPRALRHGATVERQSS